MTNYISPSCTSVFGDVFFIHVFFLVEKLLNVDIVSLFLRYGLHP